MAVIITPEPGRHKEIGQQLLALAGKPGEVRWVTWPKAGFQVSDELFAKFDTEHDDTTELVDGGETETVKDTPKRRGRPRKHLTDDNTAEGEVDGRTMP